MKKDSFRVLDVVLNARKTDPSLTARCYVNPPTDDGLCVSWCTHQAYGHDGCCGAWPDYDYDTDCRAHCENGHTPCTWPYR